VHIAHPPLAGKRGAAAAGAPTNWSPVLPFVQQSSNSSSSVVAELPTSSTSHCSSTQQHGPTRLSHISALALIGWGTLLDGDVGVVTRQSRWSGESSLGRAYGVPLRRQPITWVLNVNVVSFGTSPGSGIWNKMGGERRERGVQVQYTQKCNKQIAGSKVGRWQ
jgi:hypothetical protein